MFCGVADEQMRSQLFRKLFRHIIYGNIKTRYNVFRKYANDVFGECDFMVQKLPKSYIIRLLEKPPALKLSQSVYCKEMMGLIGAGNNPMVGMTVAVAVAIEEASK